MYVPINNLGYRCKAKELPPRAEQDLVAKIRYQRLSSRVGEHRSVNGRRFE
jgi:hypothetical protein